MFGDLGAPELLIIFAIVILLFGAGKVGRLGKDLGTAIREFRTAVRDDKDHAPINLLSGGESPSTPAQSGRMLERRIAPSGRTGPETDTPAPIKPEAGKPLSR